MLTEQVISITDLRKDTTSIINNLRLPKYVFVNNKPKAVVMDMEEYETLKRQAFIQTMQKEVEEAKKS
jgi:PHD/YefM family antitoxin component YafN of YafNO toxin-antitoxin module